MADIRHGNNDWRQRYSELYSVSALLRGCNICGSEKPIKTISFMADSETPFTSLLAKNRERSRSTTLGLANLAATALSVAEDTELTEAKNAMRKIIDEAEIDALDGETSLLELLRSRRQSEFSTQIAAQAAARDEEPHERESARSGRQRTERLSLTLRARDADRSVSRSRTSARRFDVYANLVLPPSVQPHNTMAGSSRGLARTDAASAGAPPPPPPRFSIRRSACACCSQKWKDRSAIKNVKCSGLKRNVMVYTPVVAPAKLQSAIKAEYVRAKPCSAESDMGVALSGRRSSSAGAWQLVRARRVRPISPAALRARARLNPVLDNKPPFAGVPETAQDLDRRVHSFLGQNQK